MEYCQRSSENVLLVFPKLPFTITMMVPNFATVRGKSLEKCTPVLVSIKIFSLRIFEPQKSSEEKLSVS